MQPRGVPLLRYGISFDDARMVLGRLWLLAVLVLGACSSTDSGDTPMMQDPGGPQIHVTVSGVSAEVAMLQTAVVFNGMPSKESRDLTQNLSEFTIVLAPGSRGKLIVTLSGLASERCTVATANKELDVTADGKVELPMALSAQAKSCTLTISRSGDGTGSVTSNPSGLDCGAKCTYSFPFGSRIKLSASSDAGQFFAGWTRGGCAGTADCQLVVSAPTEVNATFTSNSLTVRKAGTGVVVSQPAGIDCGSNVNSCVTGLPKGNKVRLLARADLPNCFTGWSGACTGTGACEVTGSGSASVVANFATCQQKAVAAAMFRESDLFVAIYGFDGIPPFALSNDSYYNFYSAPGFSYSYITGNLFFTPSGAWGTSRNQYWIFGTPTIKVANGTGTYEASLQNASIYAMWGSSAQDAWAVGAKIFRYNGTTWSSVPSPANVTLRGVWGASATDVWAAGASATLLHWDGTSWSVVPTGLPSNAHLGQVIGLASDDIWVTTSIPGTVLRWDGKVWSSIPVPFDNIGVLVAGYATGSTDIWLASNRDAPGAIVHWNGATWSKLETMAGNWVSVYGASPSDVWFINSNNATMANPKPNRILHLTP